MDAVQFRPDPQHAGASALVIHDAILTAVHDFAAGAEQSDDITLLVIRRTE